MNKKITLMKKNRLKLSFLIILMVGWQTIQATGISAYCQTTVTHFNIPAETASGIKLTISKIDATSMYVEIESANSDPVDLLIVNNGSGATISASDVSVAGKIRKTLTWATAPATVSIELLWSKVSMGGNWMLNTFSVPFDASCTGAVADTQAPTAFTATKGAVGATTVELLLNATDDSGAVTYSISYGAGPTVLTASGVSATQKSIIVTGLTPSTAYSFAVTAKDATGNTSANSPLTVPATTTAVPVPLVSATTPPVYSAAKVISIFSDAYTSIAGTTDFNPNWGQATAESKIQVGTDNVLAYANLTYQGINFGSDVNAVAMKYLHVDVWTADETSLQIYPISRSTGERSYNLSPLTLNAWTSFDIPITAFTSQSGFSVADLYQFKFVGSGNTGGQTKKTVYLDNIYFYDNSATVDTQAPTAFTATAGTLASDAITLLLNATDDSGAISYTISYGSGPTVLNTTGVSATQKSYTVSGLNPSTAYTFSIVAKDATGNTAANSPLSVSATTLAAIPASPVPSRAGASVISVFSEAYTNVAATDFYPGWGQTTVASQTTLGGNAVMKYTNFGYMGIALGSTVDASLMNKLHVDIYSVDETNIRLTPISAGHEVPTVLSGLTQGSWNSFDVPLTTYTGVVTSALIQFKFDGGTGKTFYMDNLYFYNDTSTGLQATETSNLVGCYPNPVKNQLNVSAASEISEVVVRNLVGQTVKTNTVNGLVKSIDLSNVAAGNYLVTVKLANGQLSTQKLVKL
jgi:hypothetical protein